MNESPEVMEQVEAQPARPNLIQRVIAVFASPTQLGEWLRLQSPWFVTLTIVVAVSAVITLLMPAELLRQALEAQASSRNQTAQLPSIGVMRAIGLAGVIGGSFIGAAVIAGVLYLIFNLIFGQSETTYRQHMSATAHAFWISLVGGLISFPLQIAKGDIQLRLGFGLLLPDEPTAFLGFFFTNVTIFGLWAAVALGAVESGLSRGRVSVGKAAGWVVVLYLIFAGITAGFRTLGAG